MVRLPTISKSLVATKTVDVCLRTDHQQYGSPIQRVLSGKHVFTIGLGGTVGVGIFVLAGVASAKYAGPAILLSFAFSSVTSAFVALCYSDLATCIPVVGSAYTYAYVSLGEVMAFVTGWVLMGQYFACAAMAAVSWSAHFSKLADLMFGSPLGVTFSKSPFSFSDTRGLYRNESNGIVNLPAMMVSVLCMYALGFGTRSSVGVASLLIGLALLILCLLFVMIVTDGTKFSHWTPFFPAPEGDRTYGIHGVMQAASQIFVVFMSIDAAAHCAQETKHPARNMPIGILGSLCLGSIISVLVLAAILAVTPFNLLNSSTPLVDARYDVFRALSWMVCFAALMGLASAVMVSLFALSRIIFAMAADGLLPPVFAQLHRKHGTPLIALLISGSLTAAVTGAFPIGLVGDLAATGTLFSFALVSLSAGILRLSQPGLERPFHMPLGSVFAVPILGCTSSLGLLFFSGWRNCIRLAIWIVLGLVVYFRYSIYHSLLRLRAPIPVVGAARASDGKQDLDAAGRTGSHEAQVGVGPSHAVKVAERDLLRC